MKKLSDKQADNLLLIFDCIEAWAVNSKGCAQLWKQYKSEIEEITEQLYGKYRSGEVNKTMRRENSHGA